MDRLVALVLSPDGEVDEQAAASLLSGFTRAQLKAFLAALRRELRRRQVMVEVAGGDGSAVREAIGARYPGRPVQVTREEGLGAGVRVSAGDDIVDASIQGYIRGIIEKLGST